MKKKIKFSKIFKISKRKFILKFSKNSKKFQLLKNSHNLKFFKISKTIKILNIRSKEYWPFLFEDTLGATNIVLTCSRALSELVGALNKKTNSKI